MSCAMTIDAVRARMKTVTRRDVNTWKTLKVGDELTLVEKAQGIPKGGHVVKLAQVVITNVTVEPLYRIDEADVAREGVDMEPSEFIEWWLESHKVPTFNSQTDTLRFLVRRIEWRYLDGASC